MKQFLILVAAVLFCMTCKPQPPAPTTFGTTGSPQPIIPNSWTVASWFIDPASGNDNNNGTTSGTALKTWHKLNDQIWGCFGSPRGCPRLRQTTTVSFISSQTDNTDPVYAFPTIENGGSLVILATLPTATFTGTFTGVTNWSSSCSTGMKVVDSVNSIGVKGAFIQDTTKSASLWCNEFSSTHTCNDSIPMSNVTAPPNAFPIPGLWTTATGGAGGASGLTIGDSYSLYTLKTVNIVDVEPVIADWNGSPSSNGVYLYHMNVFDPAVSGQDMFTWGPGVTVEESRVDRVIQLVDTPSNNDEGCVNCWINGGLIGGRMTTTHYWHANGGEITSNVTTLNVGGAGVALDGYIDMEETVTFQQGVSMGLFHVPFSTITFSEYSPLAAISYASVQSGVFICGSSATINVNGSGAFRYDSTHGGAAGVLAGSPTLEISGSTTAESHSGTSPVVVTAGISITPANLDAAAGVSGFGGAAYFKNAFIGAL